MESNNSKALNTLSKIYYILAAICVFIFIFVLVFSNQAQSAIENAFKSIELNGMDPKIVLFISLGCEAAFYVLFGWLASRVANKKSRGTLFMVLLILNITTSLIGLILDYNALGSIILAIDSFTLYNIIELRKNN